MKKRSVLLRKTIDLGVNLAAAIAAFSGIVILIWILSTVIVKGASAIDIAFFLQTTPPPGVPGGGMGNAIVGTLILVVLAVLIGVPVGLLSGVYLSEFGGETRFGSLVRFSTNVLMGIPSIVIGMFVYALVVVPTGGFSGWAGALALAILILPIIARTTEDMLVMVPNSLREAALALGAARWRTILSVVFPAARAGLVTGGLLAVARIAGETAPLLFTALNSPYFPHSLSEPTANLTVTIFNFAMSPYDDWQRLAWGASLLITVSVLVLNIGARRLVRERERRK
ncbi:MAG: phosphate ABC transporter permease PstA [Candidatus Hydrogenedentota bacterium]|nr:MAG: phosphate ABC transporter permease PstA [Candidatus Hydrogenedentota bacterium]